MNRFSILLLSILSGAFTFTSSVLSQVSESQKSLIVHTLAEEDGEKFGFEFTTSPGECASDFKVEVLEMPVKNYMLKNYLVKIEKISQSSVSCVGFEVIDQLLLDKATHFRQLSIFVDSNPDLVEVHQLGLNLSYRSYERKVTVFEVENSQVPASASYTRLFNDCFSSIEQIFYSNDRLSYAMAFHPSNPWPYTMECVNGDIVTFKIEEPLSMTQKTHTVYADDYSTSWHDFQIH